jgi:hypothetical protein
LEKLFDLNDVHLMTSIQPKLSKVKDVKLGNESKPKCVNLCKALPDNEKLGNVNMFKDFRYVFVITQVVGWENPDPTTNWRQLRENLPTVTLGRCSRHFRGEVVTSRGESHDPRGN